MYRTRSKNPFTTVLLSMLIVLGVYYVFLAPIQNDILTKSHKELVECQNEYDKNSCHNVTDPTTYAGKGCVKAAACINKTADASLTMAIKEFAKELPWGEISVVSSLALIVRTFILWYCMYLSWDSPSWYIF